VPRLTVGNVGDRAGIYDVYVSITAANKAVASIYKLPG